jgi:4-hydroxy-2-oxoheptanedioate aldolase
VAVPADKPYYQHPAIQELLKAGKAAGILSANQAQAKHYLSLGATFVAVGTDVTLLARSAEQLAQAFKEEGGAKPQPAGSVY